MQRVVLNRLISSARLRTARPYIRSCPSRDESFRTFTNLRVLRAPLQRSQMATKAQLEGAVSPAAKERAEGLLKFINAAWTQFHAVEEAIKLLHSAGFQHLSEREPWNLQPGGKYYLTRNMSTIVAFAVGAKYQPGNGFYMVGAHTDSPCLKVKPVSSSTKSGCLMVNVETYGGGLWYTWFDRDLSLAGRVLVRGEDGRLQHKLVKIDRPIMRIPMLAIHLQRGLYTDGFKPNFQTNLVPILATNLKTKLNIPQADKPADGEAATPAAPAGPVPDPRHHILLLQLLAQEVGCEPGDIVDLELNICDVQPGVIGGLQDEFIYVGRLDNLAMCYCSLSALVDSCKDPKALDDESVVRAVALFDHEEVGSDSAQGAGGPIMRDTISRVAKILGQGKEGAVERALLNSFLVSADMAHAVHPNYSDKHEPDHQPHFHKGLVLKHNHNQRYATNSVSAALFREVGRRHDIPCQEFCVRNDSPCGSTIGPILASLLGCRTIDVGIAQLAMHSIREMCGVEDVDLAYRHFLAFFSEFSTIDKILDVDSLPPSNILGTLPAEASCGEHH